MAPESVGATQRRASAASSRARSMYVACVKRTARGRHAVRTDHSDCGGSECGRGAAAPGCKSTTTGSRNGLGVCDGFSRSCGRKQERMAARRGTTDLSAIADAPDADAAVFVARVQISCNGITCTSAKVANNKACKQAKVNHTRTQQFLDSFRVPSRSTEQLTSPCSSATSATARFFPVVGVFDAGAAAGAGARAVDACASQTVRMKSAGDVGVTAVSHRSRLPSGHDTVRDMQTPLVS